MKHAILMGISQVGHEEGITAAISVASVTSLENPRRIVRIFDTHTDELLFSYRNGEPTFHG